MKDWLDKVQYALVPSLLTQSPTPSPDCGNTCSLPHVSPPVKIKRQTIKQLEHIFDNSQKQRCNMKHDATPTPKKTSTKLGQLSSMHYVQKWNHPKI